MRKIKFIANPEAGLGRARRFLPRLRQILEKAQLPFDLEATRTPNQASELARKAAGRYDAVVGIGGDGTLNEIVQGLVHTDTPLGIIPAGSGNDFIRCLNYPKTLPEIVELLATGPVRSLDVGCLNGRYFANVFGVGFDAAVNARKNGTKWVKGFSGYLWALFRTLGTYAPIRATVRVGGKPLAREAFLISIGNGTTCGGGFRLTPHARLDDGLLDVCVLDPIRVPTLLWHLPKAFNGTIERSGYATLSRGAEIVLETYETLPAHIDGEPHSLEQGLHRIRIAPEALKVVCG